MRPRIVVVGSSNTDLVVSVTQLPTPGQTVLGGALETIPGGKGANQAVAAARLGAEVRFVARLGDDAYGAAARANFEREGLDTRFIFSTPGVASGVALIAVDAQTAENIIVVAPGANAHLSAADITASSAAFEGAQATLISLEIPDEAVFAAVAESGKRGIPVLLNPAPARALPTEILAKVSVLIPNETERASLAETLTDFPGTLLTTLGSAGVRIESPGVPPITIPSFPVTAVDTVAAGDCVVAAFAVALAEGVELTVATHLACAAAALKVTRPGAQPGLPTREEVERFLAQQQPPVEVQ